MSEKEFNILRYFLENINKSMNPEKISKELGYRLDEVNKIINYLINQKDITDHYEITGLGMKKLEPYKVDNAIILAAGLSSRFIPISYELPKGLIRVKGEVLIEREIRQLQEKGIKEIVIVVGYMMEKFIYLRDKYNVKLVVNNEYREKNTHSSVYVARDYLKKTYILCSDNYYPENMFHSYEYHAFYCSIYLPGISYVERAFTCDQSGLVIDTNKPSCNQWIMYGHAYFDQNFSKKFQPILESYYGKNGVENMYWENIWAENLSVLPMYINKCTNNEILEFDSMDELKLYDPDYLYNNRIQIFENICEVLHSDIKDLKDLIPIKKGLNNQCFQFTYDGKKYLYRHPGINANGVIDREKEALALETAKYLGIDNTLLYINKEEGWKVSRFVDVKEEFNFENKEHINLLAKKLYDLHSSKLSINFRFNYKSECKKIIEILKRIDASAYFEAVKELDDSQFLFEYIENDPWQISLCHNDLYEPNLLIGDHELNVIDWEFAGDTDIGFDICKLFCVRNSSFEEIDYWCENYFKRYLTHQEKCHLVCCASIIYLYWYIWGIYGSQNNQGVSKYMIGWYDKMYNYRNMAKKYIKISEVK